MNTSDLFFTLENKIGPRLLFLGVKTSDEVRHFSIPRIREKPILFIANILRLGDNRLGHWLCILISDNRSKDIYFLDSYAINPTLYGRDFSYFINRYSDFNIQMNTKRLQASDSIVCGLYCCYFIYILSRENIYELARLIRYKFSSLNYKENDKQIFRFYIRNLNTMECNYWRERGGISSYKNCLSEINRKGGKRPLG